MVLCVIADQYHEGRSLFSPLGQLQVDVGLCLWNHPSLCRGTLRFQMPRNMRLNVGERYNRFSHNVGGLERQWFVPHVEIVVACRSELPA